VPNPLGILPPGSVARVTVDGLRVRAGPPYWAGFPDLPQPTEIVAVLSAGDLVLIGTSPLAYHPPETSPDGRGWYEVGVGGRITTSFIEQGSISGWVAEGEAGLEYLEAEMVTCPGSGTLEALLYPPGHGVDGDELTTAWDRIACSGGEPRELEGVYDYLCLGNGFYPYNWEPAFIAYPHFCGGLILDDIDAEGNGRAGYLVLRFPEDFGVLPQRGDVVQVEGHFDDPLSSTCSAATEPGFDGMAIDPKFLVLFCREQFVVDDVLVIGHRDLAPPPWEPQ
jgi:hypothetical protein